MQPESPIAVEFRDIRKTYGSVVANDAVSFSVRKGSIHGVLGENGAGKSTILKGLYGLHVPDSGTTLVRGLPVSIHRPSQALALGIGMVQQHFLLVPSLSVWRNVLLGAEPRFVKPTELRLRVEELQRRYGFQLPLDTAVEDLSVGQQQQVELLKLLYRDLDILILDEPTAVLAPQEVEALFARLRELTALGKTILVITHKLKEVFAVTDHVTVLRQGRVVADGPTASFTAPTLAEAIIGKKRKPPERSGGVEGQAPILELRSVTVEREGRKALDDVSLSVKRGEILGVAGVEGNGQEALVALLSGVDRRFRGEALFDGAPIGKTRAYDLRQKGVGVIPADRHREAVLLGFTVEENALLGHHRRTDLCPHGRLSRSAIRSFTEGLIDKFEVRPRRPDLPIRALSGGNQQKLVVARELARDVRLLIAAHPTRGVDIGSIDFLHSRLLDLRSQGAAIVLVSSELEELIALSDRIVVLYHGRIAGETTRANATERQLGCWMTGARAASEVAL